MTTGDDEANQQPAKHRRDGSRRVIHGTGAHQAAGQLSPSFRVLRVLQGGDSAKPQETEVSRIAIDFMALQFKFSLKIVHNE